MSTTSIVLIVVLIGAVLVVGLLAYQQYEKSQATNSIIGLGTKAIGAFLDS